MAEHSKQLSTGTRLSKIKQLEKEKKYNNLGCQRHIFFTSRFSTNILGKHVTSKEFLTTAEEKIV